MKITKLFHWLYAVLMLLPVFFIAGVSLYTIFNQNAKDSYYGETINEETLFQLSNLNQLQINNKYLLNAETYITYQQTGILEMTISNVVNMTDSTDLSNCNTLRLYSNVYNQNQNMFATFLNGTTQVKAYNLVSSTARVEFYLESFSYTNENTNVFLPVLKMYQYNRNSYLDNAFIYSLNQLNSVPVFSWAQNSFLSTPFNYITGLFGMQSSNPVNTLLSYWLSISVIWLVFDLVMYVPLLVHRWIDKAVID